MISRMQEALDRRQGIALGKASILLLGVAYKRNTSDVRESPALELMSSLIRLGSKVDFYDPLIPVIPSTRSYPELAGLRSVSPSPEAFGAYNAVVVATDHDVFDYVTVVANARLVVDTRNIVETLDLAKNNLVKA